jgi:hypothetical protein
MQYVLDGAVGSLAGVKPECLLLCVDQRGLKK